MINIKNQRGSITLFVLVSCMFFIASVVCIQMNMDSKQIAVEREYKQIKSNYEKDLANAKEIYTKLSQANNIDVQFRDVVYNIDDENNHNISVKAIFNTENVDIKELKYGWIYSNNIVTNPTSNTITNWTYVENANGFNQITANLNNTQTQGYYYLCLMLNNQEFWTPVTYAQNGQLLHLDAINNLGTGDKNHSTTTLTWKNLSGNGNDVALLTRGADGPVWNKDNLLFDGVDDYATGSTVTNGDITVEFVGRNNNNKNATMYMLNNWNGDVTKSTMQMFYRLNRGIENRLLVPSNMESNYTEIGGANLVYISKDNRFVNTISKDSESIKIYVNGVLLKQYTDNSFIDRFNITDISFTIGNWHQTSLNTYASNQDVNSFRIYDRALSEDEIKQNYQVDKARFDIED